MVQVILVLGYLIIAYCLVIVVQPKTLRKTIDFLSIGSRLYLAGFIRLILGIVLLFLAGQTRFWGYVVTIGLLSAASGLSLFFFALKRTKKLLLRLRNQSNLILRLYAIIGLALWVVLVYALLAAVPLVCLR